MQILTGEEGGREAEMNGDAKQSCFALPAATAASVGTPQIGLEDSAAAVDNLTL